MSKLNSELIANLSRRSILGGGMALGVLAAAELLGVRSCTCEFDPFREVLPRPGPTEVCSELAIFRREPNA